MKDVMTWEEAAVAGAAECGGKGWNLGRLHRYGFPVPAGGVLTAGVYRAFVAQEPLRSLFAQTAAITARDVTRPEVARQLEQLQSAIQAADLPGTAAADLLHFLQTAGLADRPVAVRSSATAEDGELHSFAGIHQSFLNQVGPAAVTDAVKRCYASLWSPQAVAYRRHRGLSDEEVACAVVICAMVTSPGGAAPVSAGVAFTCDPRTGRRDLFTISAAPGLGEAVVSGSVNPEEITVHKGYGELTVRRRTGRTDPVLTDVQALALSRLADRVHWALGDDQAPQDVEWAFDGSRFWLLQARPVTRLPHVTFPGAEALPVIWSNANLKDALPGIQSTLSWSLVKQTITYVMYSAMPLAGYPVPDGMQVVRRFDGRAYFDLTAMQWGFYDAIGFMPADFVKGIGGHQPTIPVPSDRPYAGPVGRRRRRSQLRFVLGLRQAMKGLPSQIKGYQGAMREMARTDAQTLSSAELLARALRRAELSRDFGPRFQAANMEAGVWPNALRDLIARFAPDRASAMVSALLAGSGQITTAEHGYRLFDLAAAAQKEPGALAYLTRQPLDPHGWRNLPAESPFRQEMERFLAEFGHRGVYEAELANPRWNEDPTFILQQVRHLAESGRTEAPRGAARQTRTAGEAELSRLPWYARPLARWMARKAQQAAALREGTKSAIASVAEPGRLDLLEVGRRLTAAGNLESPREIFHLTWIEVEMFLRGEWDGTGARALVADRKARDDKWRTRSPEDFYILDHDGGPAQMPGEAGRDSRHGVAISAGTPPASTPGTSPGHAGLLSGVGVAAGRARGTARVIMHPAEGELLEDGDILVAPSTDPGWTPLFLRASAVVMEVGGYLSHGAIVAREYGIPAVVNIPGLLKTVKSGDRLEVDGDAGTVRPVSRQPSV